LARSGVILASLKCEVVFKIKVDSPNTVDLLKAGSMRLIIYTNADALC
jgi:hypothetical protein